jgi:chemotaxis protein methyltransferase CheR
MRDADLQLVAAIVQERAGIVLGVDKAYLMESRLVTVARQFGFAGLDDLALALRRAPAEPLLAAVTEALATHETSFFRDGRPFEQLASIVLPRLISARAADRSLRIWSAAASTGQEAYSIAMCLDERQPPLTGWRLSILGTDLACAAVERARQARYSPFEVQRGLSPQRLARHCRRDGDDWVIEDRLRALTTFSQRNLLQGCRQLGRFDVIFLRNVLIYFDLATRRRVLEDVAQMLPDDGVLFLGGTETVLGVTEALTALPDARGLFQPSRRASPATGGPSEIPGTAIHSLLSPARMPSARPA